MVEVNTCGSLQIERIEMETFYCGLLDAGGFLLKKVTTNKNGTYFLIF